MTSGIYDLACALVWLILIALIVGAVVAGPVLLVAALTR